jgi:hypothetical protein
MDHCFFNETLNIRVEIEVSPSILTSSASVFNFNKKSIHSHPQMTLPRQTTHKHRKKQRTKPKFPQMCSKLSFFSQRFLLPALWQLRQTFKSIFGERIAVFGIKLGEVLIKYSSLISRSPR